MTDLSGLKFFATSDHDCGYLPEQQSRTVFVDPEAHLDGEMYSELSELGFRRSGSHVYRPHCRDCRACIPIRIAAAEFKRTRSQKRCWKRNQDLKIRSVSSIEDIEYYALYERYINERHRDGEMYPATTEQFSNFLTKEWGITEFVEFRDQGELKAVSVIDKLQNGLSAIYAFFDPEDAQRSLGVFNILYQLERAKRETLPYVYLGYWIRDCQKMSYKTDYQPFQVLLDNRWVVVRDF
ncbi:MAG: arginyltransferase [Agarilytica sp.]